MPEALVIGAGIVGLCTALQLQLRGFRITVLDANEPASGASAGNAGYLSEGSIFPMVTPALLRRLPAMLLDADSPLAIRPGYLPALAPWGLRALRAAAPAAREASMQALASISHRAIDAYAPLLAAAGAADLLERRGSLVVYRTAETLAAAHANLPRVREARIEVHPVGEAEALALEPALAPGFAGALHFPNAARCVDPQRLGQRLAQAISARGGSIVRAQVRGLGRCPSGQWQVHAGEHSLVAGQVVVAAGRWSDRLLAPLGYRVPLEGERGYHLMLPEPGIALGRPVVLADSGICATPMLAGIRLAGTVEFARDGAPMNPARADMLLRLARPSLPGLSGHGATRWMGVRPSLPDGRPAIGGGERMGGLYYCFGHGHLGLTQAAISARLLAALMAGEAPEVDLAPFGLARFQ